MARRSDSGRWDAIVADAEASGATQVDVAKKHGVTVAALKYHVYKTRKGGGTRRPRLLPVRTGSGAPALQVEFGRLRLGFQRDCDPGFVVAVLRALGNDAC